VPSTDERLINECMMSYKGAFGGNREIIMRIFFLETDESDVCSSRRQEE
jgi:hypothetical protein